MDKLLNGVRQFQSDYFKREQRLYENLASGQDPHAMIITCSDSRVQPEFVTNAKPGDIFVMRNAGNIVPHYDDVPDAESAAIELAVQELSVDDMVILGHSDCGAIKLLLAPEHMKNMPAMKNWLGLIRDTPKKLAELEKQLEAEGKPPLTETERIDKAIEFNVVEQMENLLTHPTVKERYDKGALRVHGWVLQIETGEIRAYDAKIGEFRHLA